MSSISIKYNKVQEIFQKSRRRRFCEFRVRESNCCLKSKWCIHDEFRNTAEKVVTKPRDIGFSSRSLSSRNLQNLWFSRPRQCFSLMVDGRKKKKFENIWWKFFGSNFSTSEIPVKFVFFFLKKVKSWLKRHLDSNSPLPFFFFRQFLGFYFQKEIERRRAVEIGEIPRWIWRWKNYGDAEILDNWKLRWRWWIFETNRDLMFWVIFFCSRFLKIFYSFYLFFCISVNQRPQGLNWFKLHSSLVLLPR